MGHLDGLLSNLFLPELMGSPSLFLGFEVPLLFHSSPAARLTARSKSLLLGLV
jgi:hypothetical protein